MAVVCFVAAETNRRNPVTHSTINDSPRPAELAGVPSDSAPQCPQCSASAGSHEEVRAEDASDSDTRQTAQLRWLPRLLALLFVACLVFAGWVWYQILRILI